MGKDYDAAVLAGGHCGFGLGATPTAVANMQSITEKFGPSHKAFLIVPMVGAFLCRFCQCFYSYRVFLYFGIVSSEGKEAVRKVLFMKGDLQIVPTTEPKTTDFSIE